MVSLKNTIKAKIGGLIERNPIIGKLLSTLMLTVEIRMLMILNYLDKHLSPNFKIRFMRTFFEGRWGGRVVPLNINIPVETKYLPRQEILEIISRSKVVGVGECWCRTTHKNCKHMTRTCMGLALPGGRSLHDIRYKDVSFTRISKKEIIKILNQADDEGLVHQIIYFPTPNYFYVICSCCTCCCEAISNYKKFLSPKIVKSDFIMQTDRNKCVNHGACIEICPFDARQLDAKGKLIVDYNKCFGCGLCIRKCPKNAIKLVKRKVLT
jgi:NAD-dependent dihydropyrimidine dehydrogenase PreA subunit